MCFQIETLGKVKSSQIISVEVLGSEQMRLTHSGKIAKIFTFSNYFQQIDIKQEGFEFSSDSQNAPVAGLGLFDSAQQTL
jgi:hypothetical protein